MLIAGQIPQGLAAGKNENVYISVYNNFAGVLPLGGHVCFDPAATAAQFLGRAVTRPATANLPLYAGAVVGADIPQGGWGLVCCYGNLEFILVDGGTVDSVVGSLLTLVNATFYPTASAAVGTVGGVAYALSVVTSATGSGRGLIKAM